MRVRPSLSSLLPCYLIFCLSFPYILIGQCPPEDISNVNFTSPGSICLDAGIQTDLGGGIPTGGIYSGPGVTDHENGETFSFDPVVVGVGNHEIKYSYNDPNIWDQIGNDINGNAAGDRFGNSISMSSDGLRVAIGANWNNDNGNRSGHVKVFEWDGVQWAKIGNTLLGKSAGDEFGNSVSISGDGNTIAVGSPNSNEIAFMAGQARVFRWNGADWVQLGLEINGVLLGTILVHPFPFPMMETVLPLEQGLEDRLLTGK